MDIFTQEDCYKRRWRQVQYLADVFWRRWIRSYLPLLQERQKWTAVRRNFQVGDVVLMVDTSVPRSVWPLARVVDVFPGKDKLVRRVQVQTKNGLYHRPIDKIALLEGADNN